MSADEQTALFEAQRPQLIALAYQMLGELQAAEDIVQEAWLRWRNTTMNDIQSPAAWLKQVVSRLAIDQLRTARSRREVYTGPWLPEPILGSGPARALELAQECELALLWSLERLSAEERAAFLLSQVFDTPYTDIARMLERSEASCRQLVSRARKHLASATPRFNASTEAVQTAMLAFASAAAAGNKEEVLSLLAPDVVLLADGGGLAKALMIPLHGRERVAQVFTHIACKKSALASVELAMVNGYPALVQLEGGEEDVILTVRLNEQGKICWVYSLRNPEKLAAVEERRGPLS